MPSCAHASSDISSSTIPLGEMRSPTNPPPPTHMTVRRNGFSRVQKWNPTVTASPRNGTDTSAPREMFSRLKTPTPTLGSARSKPARTPLGLTSTNGGSENPSAGMSCSRVSMKLMTPCHCIVFITTSISGLRPLLARKDNRSIAIVMSVASMNRLRPKSFSSASTSTPTPSRPDARASMDSSRPSSAT